MLPEQSLKFAVDALESRQIDYMVVGSIASIAYSHPRMTLDIDIVIDLSPARVPLFLEGFPPSEGFTYYAPAIVKSIQDRIPFNILHTATGMKWDFMPMRQDAYGRMEFSRRRRVWLTQSVQGMAASAEDVVLGKLWYYSIGESQKHLIDIANVWAVTQLDLAYIEHWVQQLQLHDAWAKARAQAPK
jgi:hypothetical protein